MNIDKIVHDVLRESLVDKAKKLTKRIINEIDKKDVCEQCGRSLQEGECSECGYMKEDIFEEDLSTACDSAEANIRLFGKDDERSQRFIKDCEKYKESKKDIEEELHGDQHKLDVAEPKGKLTRADFLKLGSKKHNKKTQEVEEEFFYSDEEDAERASEKQPTYVGRGLADNKANADMTNKILGSFNDKHGWYDETDSPYTGDFDFDYDEEEFSDFDSLMDKYGDKQRWFERGEGGKKFFDRYQKEFKGVPFRVRKRREMDEEETQEGNAFTGALDKARKEGDDEFEVDGKKYQTKESRINKLKLTESELIDLIESIVLEQKQKQEKKVLDKNKPKGYREYEKNSNLSKKQNDEYINSVTKKLTEYLKGGSKGKYETDPKQFPKGNGQLAKMNKKAYIPSGAVEEFIEEFAYSPGMENLEYDEVKPNEDWIEMNIEGSHMTGNSDEYANAEKTGLGKKINEKRKKNLYGTEKRKNSYKRVKQPIDSAGEGTGEKSLKNMFKKLEESKPNQNETILKEELSKIGNLMNYNSKTQ